MSLGATVSLHRRGLRSEGMCLGASHKLALAPESDLGGSGLGLPPAASLLRASLSDQPHRPAKGRDPHPASARALVLTSLCLGSC